MRDIVLTVSREGAVDVCQLVLSYYTGEQNPSIDGMPGYS